MGLFNLKEEKMNTDKQFISEENELIRKFYQGKNYYIRENSNSNKNALVFFSSNGIYYPNTEEVFIEKIEKQDYYEWINISKHKLILNYSRLRRDCG